MARRATMSEVKFNVRRKALALQEFTVADVVRTTGLNPESVRTELQRMKQDGLLTSRPYLEKRSERGGRPSLYRLTADPESRLELSKSLEAFYPLPEQIDRPTNHHYAATQRLLDQAQDNSDERLDEILSEAEFALEVAEDTEGGELASEVVKAYLQFERVRLLYWRGEYDEAKAQSNILQGFFRSIDEEMVKRIDAFRLYMDERASRTEAFSVSPHNRPTNQYYLSVRLLLDQAFMTEDDDQFQQLLTTAKRHFEIISQTEPSNLGVEEINSYLEYEFARFAYLSGQYEEAYSRFTILHEYFSSHPDVELIEYIEEFLLCLEARRLIVADRLGNADVSALARSLIKVVHDNAHPIKSPITTLLFHLLHHLLQTTEEEINAAAFDLQETLVDRFRAEVAEVTEEVTKVVEEGIIRASASDTLRRRKTTQNLGEPPFSDYTFRPKSA